MPRPRRHQGPKPACLQKFRQSPVVKSNKAGKAPDALPERTERRNLRWAYMIRIGCSGRNYHHWRKRSEEHTSELQSLMRISYAVLCLKKKTYITPQPCY